MQLLFPEALKHWFPEELLPEFGFGNPLSAWMTRQPGRNILFPYFYYMPVHPSFPVLRNAGIAQLELAAADNHRQLFCLGALARGGEVQTGDGIVWTYAGTANGASIVFPSLEAATAGEQLDRVMDYYRAHLPHSVGCWSLNPPQPADIGIRLLARGFQPGWQPCWMALELDAIRSPHARPEGLEIKADNDTIVSGIKDLPYKEDGAYMSQPLLQAYPGQAQRFIATLDGSIVAHSCVFLTTGDHGVAGIYNVGVLPRMRNKGIGKAIVLAACLYAKEKGYGYAMLNANHMGRPVYEQLGFRFISYGLTWWLMGHRYANDPPSPARVLLAEATGRGDIAALEALGKQFTAVDLNTPLTNRMTLIQLAVHCRQPAAAEWLINRGAVCTALDAWDFQWKDRAAALLAGDPQEVNRRYYDWNATLMHVAAERNDTELAQLALSAGADLTIQDTEHQGNALDWALFFKRPEIIRLIKEQTGRS